MKDDRLFQIVHDEAFSMAPGMLQSMLGSILRQRHVCRPLLRWNWCEFCSETLAQAHSPPPSINKCLHTLVLAFIKRMICHCLPDEDMHDTHYGKMSS